MANFINKVKSALGMRPNPIAVPPAIPVLQQHRNNFWGCVPPRRPGTDTPLDSLYRMYAALVMHNNVELRNEFEYFWGHDKKAWNVAALPDPHDPNAQRYAIVSIIPELLCESFNHLIEMGVPRNRPALIDAEEEAKYKAMPKVFETLPSWCERVPALESELVLTNSEGANPVDRNDDSADQRFLRKNIVILDQTLFFT